MYYQFNETEHLGIELKIFSFETNVVIRLSYLILFIGVPQI